MNLKPEIEIVIQDARMREFMPAYATPGAAAIDLRAYVDQNVILLPGQVATIGTGIRFNIFNPGICAMLLPRSGLGRQGLILANSVGLLDSDYQGELKVVAWNRSREGVLCIEPMMRIAQLCFVPVLQPTFKVVERFEGSFRGEGGFGSTGNS